VLLAWRAGDNPRSVVDHTGLSTALLTGYFQQEFLRTLPDADRRFLLDTAVLDRLSGELCDAVLETSASGDRLEALVRSGNAFVIPSGHTGVFRYHPLFSDMLLAEFRKAAPDREVELRLRAIEWFDAHGEHNAVVDQALASDGRIDPSPWIFKYIVPLIGRGEVATLGRWLGSFAPQDLRTDPLLALTSAWHALYTNRPDEMERWIETAGTLAHDGPLPDGTADMPTAIAAMRMLTAADGVLQTADDARSVRDAGVGSGPWRGVAMLLGTVALQLAGKVTDVRPLFEQAEFETRGMPAAHSVTLAHLALDSMRRDDDLADDEIRRALDEVEGNGLTQFRHVSIVYCAKALSDARAGRFEASLQTSDHAEVLLIDTVGTPRAQIHHRLVLADAAIDRSDWATANRLVREAAAHLHLEPDARLLHEWVDRLAQRCARQAARRHQPDLTPAEQRVLLQLATHFTLGEIADHLYVSRNTVKTHTVSIYRKLGVSGRSEAIERATELGLFDGGLDERVVVTAR
jgi:LuxR family maltose regulon positive regulatory protein